MSTEEAPKDFGICCICREEIAPREVCTFACGHSMHAKCAFLMRSNTDLPLKCPICRAEVDVKTKDADDRYPLTRILFDVADITCRSYLCKKSVEAIYHDAGFAPESVLGRIAWWLLLVGVAILTFGTKDIFCKIRRTNSNHN